jgi:hypothetical protein
MLYMRKDATFQYPICMNRGGHNAKYMKVSIGSNLPDQKKGAHNKKYYAVLII